MIGEQDLLVVLDCETLFRGVQTTYGVGARINYKKMTESLTTLRPASCIHLRAYVMVKAGQYGQIDFLSRLTDIGYDVKPLLSHYDAATQISQHEDIFERIHEETINFSCVNGYPKTVIVGCGSIMLLSLYQELQARGSTAIVIGFGKSVSSFLYGVEKKILGPEFLLEKSVS